MNGISVHITGIVQGVGFRPWVWKTATRLGLAGTVQNNFDGVHIELYGEATASFFQALENDPPPLSRIDSVRTRECLSSDCPVDFQILESELQGESLLRISPDIAICADCRRELFDPSDRRHRYPFINCVNCGPRFTIIESLPYDRLNTGMRHFELCDACRQEYTAPSDRRYHAQPIACAECGPSISFCSADSQSHSALGADAATWEDVWQESMEQGKIVAVKGVGGFHLACDALNAEAVSNLRKRKRREAKPFALMVPDLAWVKSVCSVSEREEELLLSRERPIVLLKLKKVQAGMLALLAPGLDTLGIMLPYSPMHEIMFDRFPGPVVMTSANYSSEPMIHTNEDAFKKLGDIADIFITHDRPISNRCDDPVCAVHDGQTIVIRPGRGVAPVSMPIAVPQATDRDRCILAFGADMKNTFALAHHGQMTLHPYIGDLDNPDAQEILMRSIQRELACFKVRPELIVHDLHPDYFSTQMALRFSNDWKVPTIGIQHHHAHLVGAHPGKAIGFAFDGTGFGADETIWGGEVMVYDASSFERVYKLLPFALPGGDAAVKHPRRVLEALLYPLQDGKPALHAEQTSFSAQIESGINCPMTSSMGRLFDAVSCLLGICEHPTFDGEAAMRLEAAADEHECGDFAFEIKDGMIDWRPMLNDLLEEMGKGIAAEKLAARFHNTLAEIVYCCGRKLSEKHGNLPWVFAGGVFQNRLLTDRIRQVVGDEFELVFSGCPNDSGIPLGQTIIGANQWALR